MNILKNFALSNFIGAIFSKVFTKILIVLFTASAVNLVVNYDAYCYDLDKWNSKKIAIGGNISYSFPPVCKKTENKDNIEQNFRIGDNKAFQIFMEYALYPHMALRFEFNHISPYIINIEVKNNLETLKIFDNKEDPQVSFNIFSACVIYKLQTLNNFVTPYAKLGVGVANTKVKGTKLFPFPNGLLDSAEGLFKIYDNSEYSMMIGPGLGGIIHLNDTLSLTIGADIIFLKKILFHYKVFDLDSEEAKDNKLKEVKKKTPFLIGNLSVGIRLDL